MSLSNLKVIILGSGTCVPSLKRSSCSVLMQTDSSKILFDLGAGTIKRLLEANVTIFEISHIFISHFHPDHTGELVSFLFANKYAEPKNGRGTPLTIVGGKGFLTFFNGLKNVFGHWIDLGENLLKIKELHNNPNDSYQGEDFLIESITVSHNEESIAYRINFKNSVSVVYSGDTDYSDNLINLSANADILICESSHPDDKKAKGHLTPSLAGNIASLANVKKLVLTHFYPECDNADIEKECRKTYNGHIVLAKDLMRIL